MRISQENLLSKCRISISFSMNIAKLCSTFLLLNFLSSVVIIITIVVVVVVVVVVANRTCGVGAPLGIVT